MGKRLLGLVTAMVLAACGGEMPTPACVGTDAACGGNCHTKCSVGQICATGADCVTGVCGSGKCLASTCSDGVSNGDENSVDCGGSCPTKRCPKGAWCEKNEDCVSGSCTPCNTPGACSLGTCK